MGQNKNTGIDIYIPCIVSIDSSYARLRGSKAHKAYYVLNLVSLRKDFFIEENYINDDYVWYDVWYEWVSDLMKKLRAVINYRPGDLIFYLYGVGPYIILDKKFGTNGYCVYSILKQTSDEKFIDELNAKQCWLTYENK